MSTITLSATKLDYITITQPNPIRYGENRKLNLVNFLPSMMQGTETQQFTQFFEDFLNTMFDGDNGITTYDSDVNVAGNYSLSGVSGVLVPYTYQHPVSASISISADTNSIESLRLSATTDTSNKISILEKVHRLTELKDPDLIDIEYIQYFAANLGYSVSVYRQEVGNVGSDTGLRDASTSATSAADINRYLRFMVSNLPNWYKIKATDSAMKVMLYSFGLVGDLINYYTDSYLHTDDGGKWVQGSVEDFPYIPKEYFSTPHFAVRIMVDESLDLITDVAKRSSVIRAVQSLQPINTVFRQLSGYALRSMNLNMSMMTRFTRYIRIEA